MNWKKEGYVLSQDVCVVLSVMGKESKVLAGKVTYVGVKKLKVALDDSREIEFSGSTSKGGGIWGYIYYVYKNKDEYNAIKKSEELKYDLCEYIKDSVKSMSVDDLNYIKNYIESKK